MITKIENGHFWQLTPEDVDPKRIEEALSLTNEAIWDLAEQVRAVLGGRPI